MKQLKDIVQLVQEIKEQGYQNICFMQPALSIGGGPFVEAKLAEYLANKTDLNIYFCDYKDGYGEYLLRDTPKVKKLTFKDNDIYFPLQEKCILITNSTRVVLIKNMHPESKILFWHYETVKCGWHVVLIDGETNKFLNLTKKENAMVYHDWSGRDSLSRSSNVKFTNQSYIHVVVPLKEKVCSSQNITKDEINACFLSRLAPDKINSLFYLIKNLARYNTDRKKRLHIIGDGVSRKIVENFCISYSKEIEFIFTGTLAREDLDDYLIKNVDILFGVGTCVIEGASLKIPSAILLINSSSFDDVDAIWLYNSKEYTVGILKEEKENFKVTYTPIHEMLDDIYVKDKKTKQGNKCYQYFMQNHNNYDELVCNFLSYLRDTTLTFKRLKKCIKYVPYSLYSYQTWCFKKMIIMKKTHFIDKTKYLLFGFLEIFSIKQKNKQTIYRFLGIPFYKSEMRKVWDFSAARFDNRKQYMQQKK